MPHGGSSANSRAWQYQTRVPSFLTSLNILLYSAHEKDTQDDQNLFTRHNLYRWHCAYAPVHRCNPMGCPLIVDGIVASTETVLISASACAIHQHAARVLVYC